MSDPLKARLAGILADAGPRATALLEKTLADARAIGGEVAARAADVAAQMERMLGDAAAGRISADVAELAVARYLDALGELAGGAAEASARQGIARVRDGLEVAKDVAFALVRAGIAAAAAGL